MGKFHPGNPWEVFLFDHSGGLLKVILRPNSALMLTNFFFGKVIKAKQVEKTANWQAGKKTKQQNTLEDK